MIIENCFRCGAPVCDSEMCEMSELIESLQQQNKKLLSAAKAFRDLNSCYRIGKSPSEKLFSSLEKANLLLEQIEELKAGK